MKSYEIIRKGDLDDYFNVLKSYKLYATKKDKQFFHPPILVKRTYRVFWLLSGLSSTFNFLFLIPKKIRYRLYVVSNDFEEEIDKRIKAFLFVHDNTIGMMTFKGYRKRGLAKSLILKAFKDYKKLRLSVFNNNEKAYNLYLQMGFKPVEQIMEWRQT